MVATALPTKSLLPLAPFAYNWVGGDIHGLAAFAGTLYGYVPAMRDVVTALNKKVAQVASDAGWQGQAAQAFTTNWEKVSAEVNAIGLVVIQAASTVDELAAELAKIENALEDAADQVAAHGVHVGPDGQPPAICYGNPTQEQWRLAYASFYTECKDEAEDARVQAAGELVQISSSITSGKGGGDSSDTGTDVGEGTTIADLLFDLLATRTAYANKVAEQVEEAESKAKKAAKAWQAARTAARQADGRFGKMPDDVKADWKGAKAELESVESELASAKSNESAISKLFGTRLSDLPGVTGYLGKLSDADVLAKALDLPVVDVVAGGISTVLNAQADIHKGVPFWAAYPLETGGTVVSIVAGAAVATAVGGAVAGLSIAGAPVLGVAAGVAAGAVVAYGVGDYIHNYIADFGQQWHEHGALGIVTDFGAAGVSTWDDTAHLASDAGHVASDAWHGLTSLF
ncbi:MAG TPA: hypothetical protein VMG38_03095 [Trebonia sp.]|nr:hypothetical protein [Trebonia sp.]